MSTSEQLLICIFCCVLVLPLLHDFTKYPKIFKATVSSILFKLCIQIAIKFTSYKTVHSRFLLELTVNQRNVLTILGRGYSYPHWLSWKFGHKCLIVWPMKLMCLPHSPLHPVSPVKVVSMYSQSKYVRRHLVHDNLCNIFIQSKLKLIIFVALIDMIYSNGICTCVCISIAKNTNNVQKCLLSQTHDMLRYYTQWVCAHYQYAHTTTSDMHTPL